MVIYFSIYLGMMINTRKIPFHVEGHIAVLQRATRPTSREDQRQEDQRDLRADAAEDDQTLGKGHGGTLVDGDGWLEGKPALNGGKIMEMLGKS